MKKKFECNSRPIFELTLMKFFEAEDCSQEDIDEINESFGRLGKKHIAIIKCYGGTLPKIWQKFVNFVERNHYANRKFKISDLPENVLGFKSVNDMNIAVRCYNDDYSCPFIEISDGYENVPCHVFDLKGDPRKINLVIPVFEEISGVDPEEIFWQRVKGDSRISHLCVEGVEII